MNFDDDDFDFDYDDLSPEEREEIEKDIRDQNKKRRAHPLYKKAKEVYDTASALVESLKGEQGEMYGNTIRESAMMLAPKLAGAMGSGSWIISMQNAAIIRYHAEYLLTSTSGLKMLGEADKDYIQLLRNDMIEFRKLFKEWVSTFPALEEDPLEDEWGLFLR